MTYEIRGKVFNVLVLNSILAGAFLSVVVRKGGPLLFETAPELLWIGLAFLALSLPLYPVLHTWGRVYKNFDLSFWRFLAAALVGAVVAPVIHSLM